MKNSKIIFLIFFFVLLFVNIVYCNEAKVIELDIDNYQEEFLESKIPVIVYFWASWCKPCKLLSPIIERLAIFYDKKVKFVKIDTDGSRKLLNPFRPLRGLPLLIFYKNGEEIDRIIGFTTFTNISTKIIFLLREEKTDKKDKEDCKGGVCDPPPGY